MFIYLFLLLSWGVDAAGITILPIYNININCNVDDEGKLSCDFLGNNDIKWRSESEGIIDVSPAQFRNLSFISGITSSPNYLLQASSVANVITLKGQTYHQEMEIPFSIDSAYSIFNKGLTSNVYSSVNGSSYSVSGQTLNLSNNSTLNKLYSDYLILSSEKDFVVNSSGFTLSFNKGNGGISGIVTNGKFRSDVYVGSADFLFSHEYGFPWGMGQMPVTIKFTFKFNPNVSSVELPSSLTFDVTNNSQGKYIGSANFTSIINGSFSSSNGLSLSISSASGGYLKNGEEKIPFKLIAVPKMSGEEYTLIDGENNKGNSTVIFRDIAYNYSSSFPINFKLSFITKDNNTVSGNYTDILTFVVTSNIL